MQKTLSKNFGKKIHKRSALWTGNPSTNGHQTRAASLQQQSREKMANVNPRSAAANLQLKRCWKMRWKLIKSHGQLRRQRGTQSLKFRVQKHQKRRRKLLGTCPVLCIFQTGKDWYPR